MELLTSEYVVVKGFIDAKDDKSRVSFGSFLALVSRRNIKYVSTMFSKEEIPKHMDWVEMLALHQDKASYPDRDPMIIHDEEELEKFLKMNVALNTIAKNQNVKQAEQAVSRFCLDQLQLKAVSFIDFKEASDNDVALFERSKPAPKVPGEEPSQEEAGAPAGEDMAAMASEQQSDIFVRCDPVLDPVNGIAMNELRIGDYVLGKLPEDSVFYKLLTKNFGDFDGIVTAKVTGILQNDIGTATVSLELSDGVSGVMKLSGKVRIKVAHIAPPDGGLPEREKRRLSLSTEAVFLVAGVVVLLSAALMLYYIFG